MCLSYVAILNMRMTLLACKFYSCKDVDTFPLHVCLAHQQIPTRPCHDS